MNEDMRFSGWPIVNSNDKQLKLLMQNNSYKLKWIECLLYNNTSMLIIHKLIKTENKGLPR